MIVFFALLVIMVLGNSVTKAETYTHACPLIVNFRAPLRMLVCLDNTQKSILLHKIMVTPSKSRNKYLLLCLCHENLIDFFPHEFNPNTLYCSICSHLQIYQSSKSLKILLCTVVFCVTWYSETLMEKFIWCVEYTHRSPII